MFRKFQDGSLDSEYAEVRTDIIKGSAGIHNAMIQTLFGTPQPSFLDKMKQAVTRTRENLSERIDEVMALTKEIDSSTLDDLEGILLGADLGMKTTQEILSKLREKADRKQIKDAG